MGEGGRRRKKWVLILIRSLCFVLSNDTASSLAWATPFPLPLSVTLAPYISLLAHTSSSIDTLKSTSFDKFIGVRRQNPNTRVVPLFLHSCRLLHLLHQGAVITPAMDHTMSMQPASMMGPITQQMNHLSLGTTGSVSIHCGNEC